MKEGTKVNADLKITIDQLKNYLGTGLKVTFESDEHEHDFIGLDITIHGVQLISAFNDFGTSRIEDVKPICYRLSDLDKFIPELGFVPIEKIRDMGIGHVDWITKERNHWVEKYGLEKWIGDIPFAIIQKLFQWHFWPFGDQYFDQGLVIDKMKQGKEGTNV